MIEQDIHTLVKKLTDLKSEVSKVIVGQEEVVEQIIIAMVANGHALLEGVPGLAKTLMIRSVADAVNLAFKRIQFTPDLMPSDITGTEVLQEDAESGKRYFKFIKGPIFANIILADEINRTPPKTQAALLEVMQELEVTYAGTTYSMEPPFFILATQNPIEQAGTFTLPEAQLDRFLFYIRIQYPTAKDEFEILKKTTGRSTGKIEPVISKEDILQIQQLVKEVHIDDDLIQYVTDFVRATRPAETSSQIIKDWVKWGAGPRAGQAMILTAKGHALMNQRFSVTLDDLKKVAPPVFRHRLMVNFKAEAKGVSSDSIIEQLLEEIQLKPSKM